MQRANRNPLERGVYRVDFAPELAPVFGRWRRAQNGKVHLLELEDGPAGKARVSFAVFGRPGAFPFGQLGFPERGDVVGALPDWTDVLGFIMDPLGSVEAHLVSSALAWARDAVAPELEQLRTAIAVVKTNIALVNAQLEAIRTGHAANPAAMLQSAGLLVQQSIELLLKTAGGIAIEFPRDTVNELLKKLHVLAEAIKAAPGKAMHAVTSFAKGAMDKVVTPFVLPYEIGMGGIGVLGLAAFLAYEQGKVTDQTKNLALVGGAIALLGGGLLGRNIVHALSPSEKKT